MKKTLLIALILVPFFGISQTKKPVTDFLGIPFGSNPEKVKTELKNKGARFLADSSEANLLLFTNISWESRKNLFMYVRFVDDKAFEADLVFYTDVSAKAIENYNNVVKEVNGIYGLGDSRKNFDAPYAEYDGKELEAIAEGKALYSTGWIDLKNHNALEARIMPGYYTALRFENEDLLKLAARKANGN